MTRLFAIVLAVFFLGLAALMASVTIFVRDPMPVLSARAPVSFEQGDPAVDGVRATVAVDPTYSFEIMGEAGARDTPPRISMRQGEGEGDEIEIEMGDAGAGLFQAHGQFTAPGRWTLEINDGTADYEFGFILQE